MTAAAKYGAAFAGISVAALLLAALWPAEGAARWAAVVGVVLCVVSGALSLGLKGWVRSLNGALMVVVLVFGLRAALVMVGGLWASRWGGGVVPFVLGFFGTFLPLQWVEIGFLARGR